MNSGLNTGLLTFLNSQSVAQFKTAKQIDVINIVKNPKTEKIFFSYIGGTGAVAASLDKTKPMLISTVRGEEGEEFLMLHNEASANIIDSI